MVSHNENSGCCKCTQCQIDWTVFKPSGPNPFLSIGINVANPKKYDQRYYVTQDGFAVTEPMTAGDIVAKFGAIRELEASGFKVVPA